jgi:hypothetical protein
MPPRNFSFAERLGMSHGAAAGATVRDILKANIPGAWDVRLANETDDRHGTDWWVERSSGEPISVDCKVRSSDWATKGSDDLALESWSVIESQKVGWTRDENKQTDYILWLWQDTGRWCLIPFPMLCKVFSEKWSQWALKYKSARQRTENYHSECVFVPRKVVWAAIYRRFGGDLKAIEKEAA